MRDVYRVLVARRKVGDHWEDLGVDNIKMDLREVEIDLANWTQLAQIDSRYGLL
jgi:hypothetical protein